MLPKNNRQNSRIIHSLASTSLSIDREHSRVCVCSLLYFFSRLCRFPLSIHTRACVSGFPAFFSSLFFGSCLFSFSILARVCICSFSYSYFRNLSSWSRTLSFLRVARVRTRIEIKDTIRIPVSQIKKFLSLDWSW